MGSFWDSPGKWALNRNDGDEHFPDVFADYASTVMPETISDCLKWSEFIALSHGTYRSALERVLAYFLTDHEYEDSESIGEDEKENWDDFFRSADIKRFLRNAGLNLLVYANGFLSVEEPFQRYLTCPSCYARHPLREVATNPAHHFHWQSCEFHARCLNPKCGHNGAWIRKDIRTEQAGDLVLKCWNPHYIDIIEEPYTGRCRYVWRIPEKNRRLIREGFLHVLETTPWEVIEAVKQNRNFEFAPGHIFHLREDALAGHDTSGWGVSRILTNFRQAWYTKVLHRANESVAMDYVVPFRVLTPSAQATDATAEGMDVLHNMNAGNFQAQVRAMIRNRRRNPTGWYTLPFPVEYNMLGGEANQLAPFELLDQATGLLLNDIGVPMEMYRGTLKLDAAPPALRLFESFWQPLVHGLNSVLRFVVQKVADCMRWEPAKARLARVTVIDDLNDQMVKLQLIQNQLVSATTGLAAIGLDWRAEQRRLLEEQRFTAEQQARLQREMDAAALGEQMAQPPAPPPGQQGAVAPMGGFTGQPPAGGDPAAAGGATSGDPSAQPAGAAADINNMLAPTTASTSPQDMLAKSQAIAQSMMSLPPGQYQSQMQQLKAKDPQLWAQVKAVKEDIDQQARTRGKEMILSSQFGKQAALRSLAGLRRAA